MSLSSRYLLELTTVQTNRSGCGLLHIAHPYTTLGTHIQPGRRQRPPVVRRNAQSQVGRQAIIAIEEKEAPER